MDGWNTTFLLGFGLFSGAMLVSGRVSTQVSWGICSGTSGEECWCLPESKDCLFVWLLIPAPLRWQNSMIRLCHRVFQCNGITRPHRPHIGFHHGLSIIPTTWTVFVGSPTWRIIPVSQWLITMASKSPKWDYSPYKCPKWLINGGY